ARNAFSTAPYLRRAYDPRAAGGRGQCRTCREYPGRRGIQRSGGRLCRTARRVRRTESYVESVVDDVDLERVLCCAPDGRGAPRLWPRGRRRGGLGQTPGG